MDDFHYGREPVVAIFADGAAELARAEAFVAATRARVGVRAPLADAIGRLDVQAFDAVVAHLGEADADVAGALLDRLNEAAEADRFGSVVAFAPALIDLAVARAPHAAVTLLCPDDAVEAVAALEVALAMRPPLVLEERNDETPGQLRRLREEVGRIARALAKVSGDEERVGPAPALAPLPDGAARRAIAAPTLRALIRARRQRDQFFAADLFADPAWDMLLDLMLARLEGRLVAVSSLCIAAAVPPTTALRWIKRLTEEGLFIRSADPRDGRRVFIDLSEACAERMAAYLHSLSGVPVASL